MLQTHPGRVHSRLAHVHPLELQSRMARVIPEQLIRLLCLLLHMVGQVMEEAAKPAACP